MSEVHEVLGALRLIVRKIGVFERLGSFIPVVKTFVRDAELVKGRLISGAIESRMVVDKLLPCRRGLGPFAGATECKRLFPVSIYGLAGIMVLDS